MLELIIFVIIIVVILNKNKKKPAQNPSRQTPPIAAAPSPKKPAFSQTSVNKQEPPKEEGRTFIQPTKPYRPARNAGERYEEWTPVPEGKKVCCCGYCGADNLIPKNSDPSSYTCYFCREEL